MKVLILTNLYPTLKKRTWGIFVKEQVESLRKCFPDQLHIDVYLIDNSESKMSYLKALFYLPFLIHKKKYDLVHVHYGLTLISALFVFAPIVVTWHGSDILLGLGKKLGPILKRKADCSICVSHNVKLALGEGEIIPCGIDVRSFALPVVDQNNSALFGQFSEYKKKIKILFPANPENKVKNYPFFQEICIAIKKRGWEVQEVHLTNIARNEVPAIYWKSDVMILTSFSEGSPTVIKEAIAAKLPFVSVDVGDVKKWCEVIDFGRVVVSSKSEEFVDTIFSLLRTVTCRNKLDNTQAVRLFDAEIVAQKIKKQYDEVLGFSVNDLK